MWVDQAFHRCRANAGRVKITPAIGSPWIGEFGLKPRMDNPLLAALRRHRAGGVGS
jgi:hypothetical protein